VGYGTKMGLAPLHTWLPDAHSEAPPTVSALLSGALLNCALLGILRALQVCTAAGQGAFAAELLTMFGLLSMGLAAVFMIRQPEYKRLLAYSSVEHMGIIAVGIGVGSAGALLHIAAHSFTKGMLFLLAGNILLATKSREVNEAQGILRRLPLTGALWLAGFLALTGTPPFGTFVSEFAIAQAAFGQGRVLVGGLYLALLALAFIALADIFLRMAYGKDEGEAQPEPRLAVVPALGLGLLVLLLGIWLPPGLAALFAAAARDLGGLL
ncbi:MAG TPA: proton-conducting transporter membrane subunit, partial [bacterium]|nr:proton-conducting transporter membrane subunit [bacterium]